MHFSYRYMLLLTVIFGVLLPSAAWAVVQPTFLRCEYRINPKGIDVTLPRLSWELKSDSQDQKQSAYHLLVASSSEKLAADQGDLWDSGQVESDQTLHIEYAGKPLASRARCYWKVRVWNHEKTASDWSTPAFWSMGLLNQNDWQAQWIDDSANRSLGKAAPVPNPKLHGYRSKTSTRADRPKWVMIDLGESHTVDTIVLCPCRFLDEGKDIRGYLFPVRFSIEAALSRNFKDARILVDRSQRDHAQPSNFPLCYRISPTGMRYIRLRVPRLRQGDDGKFGFAMSEIQILSGSRNVARNAKVFASDSIESDAWKKAYLIDGRSASESRPAIDFLPASYLRKEFSIPGKVQRATAYVSGLGSYELHLNGQRIGDQILAPEITTYEKRIHYQTLDVTKQIRSGANTVGAILGDGWLRGPFYNATHPSLRAFQGRRGLVCQLEIELSDGSKQVILSDTSWKGTNNGPIREQSLYYGENYDARKEQTGWNQHGFNDSQWKPAETVDFSGANLVWQRNEPIRMTRELQPVALTEPQPGVYIFDLGQNMAGWARLKIRGPKGTTVTLRHAEMLNADGTAYLANLRNATQTNLFIKRRDEEETFEPHFTYHGFRYVEVTGLKQPPKIEDLVGKVFRSAAREVSSFACSDPLINQLMSNILWTQRANLMGLPTDCPQRDERGGWMGDFQSFSQTAIFNMDMASFLNKSMQDVRDVQTKTGVFPNYVPHPSAPSYGVPAWADGGVIIPWRCYENYADRRLLEQHFDSACRWVDYVHKRNPNFLWEKNRGNDYGDWLNGDTLIHKDWPRNGGAVSKELLATAFFANSAHLVSKMARVIGHDEAADHYHQLWENIRSAFQKAYVQPDGKIKGETQAAYALALHFDLLPEELRTQAVKNMVRGFDRYQGHMSTGIQASHRLMLELSRHGESNEAYRLIKLRSFPSWGFMIENGATTIWERWDGFVQGRGFQSPGMNSFNHWVLGAVGEWVWRNVVGIQPDANQPGYKHFVLRPHPGGDLTWAKGTYHSIRGPIQCDWKKTAGIFTMEIAIPPNTSATVYMPTSNVDAMTESGNPVNQSPGVKLLRTESDQAIFSVSSGHYQFSTPAP